MKKASNGHMMIAYGRLNPLSFALPKDAHKQGVRYKAAPVGAWNHQPGPNHQPRKKDVNNG